MLDKSMSLHEMMYFEPQDGDMLSLPLEVLAYVKVFVTSIDQQLNTNFISYLSQNNIKDYIYDFQSTTFYTFESPNKDRCVTLFELYSTISYYEISDFLYELLSKYTHDCDIVFDFFTHDNHLYRLTDIAGEIKIDQLR